MSIICSSIVARESHSFNESLDSNLEQGASFHTGTDVVPGERGTKHPLLRRDELWMDRAQELRVGLGTLVVVRARAVSVRPPTTIHVAVDGLDKVVRVAPIRLI